jgi:hypothetical protein
MKKMITNKPEIPGTREDLGAVTGLGKSQVFFIVQERR